VPHSTATVVLRITGPLSPRLLERSLAEIARRHEILRTTFAVFRGEPVQIVTRRFDRETAEGLANRLRELLEAVAAESPF
jgi:hypothetical protein